MAILELISLGVDIIPEGIDLTLKPGMTALFMTSDDQESKNLLDMFTGTSLPEKGKVLLDGLDTSIMNRQQIHSIRKRIALVTGTGGLVANLKMWENIMLPLLYHNDGITAADEQKALSLLDSIGFKGNLMSLPGHLSLFERRVASFVRAAIKEPELMIYSGCFDNLSSTQRHILMEQANGMQSLNPRQASLFITSYSHPLDELSPDKVFNLRKNNTLSKRQS